METQSLLYPSLLLYCKEYSSDKLYYAEVKRQHNSALWGVYTRYGRYPTLNNGGWKCQSVSLDKALHEYVKIVTEKLNKGYQPIGFYLDSFISPNTEPNLFDHDPTYRDCIQLLSGTLQYAS